MVSSNRMKSLIISTTAEDKEKKELQKVILKRRGILEKWTEKLESLKLELDLIKHEYHVRVGALLLKDNQLDLEIVQLKNLKELMSQGLSYDEAVKQEEDAFYNDILRMQQEQEEITEEEALLQKRDSVEEGVKQTVKEVWKKLIRKFHPDLVTDVKEKTKREEIMKQINNAYAAFDLETLKQFENYVDTSSMIDYSPERLEKILEETEQMIQQAIYDYKDLRDSQWYGWKIKIDKERVKAKKKQTPMQDVFKDLENQLLNDIVKKIAILRRLREEVVPSNRIKI